MSFVSIVFSNGGDLIEELKKLFLFIQLPSYILIYKEMNTIRVKKIIISYYTLLSIFFIVMGFTSSAYIQHNDYGEYISDSLTLNISNSNETAIYLFCCFIIMIVSGKSKEKRFTKVLFYIISAFLLVLIYLTNSRTAMILSLFVLLCSINKIAIKIKKIPIWLILLLPLIFLIFNLTTYIDFFSNITFFNKPINSGRANIYQLIISDMKPLEFIFGNFSKFRFENLHNGYLSTIATIGVAGLALFIIYLNNTLTFLRNNVHTQPELTAFIGIISIILYCSTEASLMVSGSIYASVIATIFILALHRSEEQRKTYCK